MIHLSFNAPAPGAPWRKTWDSVSRVDTENISEMDLRYKHFGASVDMTIGDVEIISKNRFVTLVDLALSISHAIGRLSAGEDAALGFTESEEVIHLRRDGDLVEISSTKRPFVVSVENGELVRAFEGFLEGVHSHLTTSFPGLIENPVIRRLSPR
ncbi:hypothetical protein [Streptomyces noursei]|uniref:hypothetical protein n=1 Tax=Streptomyces noursei TaxID=1971 RepID=UPI0037FCA06E